MKKDFYGLKRSIKAYWKDYLKQALLSVSVLFIILILLTTRDMVVIASIGATSFIVFAMPHAKSASAKAVIISYTAGLFFGSLFGTLPFENIILKALIYSSAVGCTIFFMLATDTKHPPAAGAALGVSMTGFEWDLALAVIGSALILSAVHYMIKHELLDFSGSEQFKDSPLSKHETHSQ